MHKLADNAPPAEAYQALHYNFPIMDCQTVAHRQGYGLSYPRRHDSGIVLWLIRCGYQHVEFTDGHELYISETNTTLISLSYLPGSDNRSIMVIEKSARFTK